MTSGRKNRIRLSDVTVLIPAFQPDQALTSLVHALFERGVGHILLVDDGTTKAEALTLLDEVATVENVRRLTHASNRGKGAALKSGFRNLADCDLVICADADGQHHPDDIVAVARRAMEDGQCVLGVRQMDQRPPLRSRIGNGLTRWLFKHLLGHDVIDTQTGLRALWRSDRGLIADLPQDKYDYELAALITLLHRGSVVQHSIRVIYEPGNPKSHFRPIGDSFKIYRVLFAAAFAQFRRTDSS